MTIGKFTVSRTVVIAAVAVLFTVLAWAALRDAANRMGSPTPAVAEQEAPFGTTTPDLGSSFSPGPELGDLQSLFASADVLELPEIKRPARTVGRSSSSSPSRSSTSSQTTITEEQSGTNRVTIIQRSETRSGSEYEGSQRREIREPRKPRQPEDAD